MSSSSKKKKVQEMQRQDALGISRKKWKFTMSPKLFIALKLALIIAIPVIYFVYSPLLILVMILYISLFFLSVMAEHQMNKSVIKKNHLHFIKFDSAIALIVVIISIVSSVSAVFKNSEKSSFGNFETKELTAVIEDKGFKGAKNFAKKSRLKTNFINFCSLITGERNVFSSGDNSKFKIGTMEPPSDFPIDAKDVELPNKEDLPADFDEEFSGEVDGKMPEFDRRGGKFDKNALKVFDNIPIEYVSSSLISTVNTVLIFSVSIFGAISLFVVYLKKRKMERIMNEVIVEGKLELLSDNELERILSFGEDYKNDINKTEIAKKIKQEHSETLKKEKKEKKQSFIDEDNIEIFINSQSIESLNSLGETVEQHEEPKN